MKELDEIRFERTFNGVYCFDAKELQEARELQEKGDIQEAIKKYNKVSSNYETRLAKILNIESKSSVMFVSPCCILEENKYEAETKQKTTIEELAAKIYLSKAMINELEKKDNKKNLKKSAEHYKKLGGLLGSLANSCSSYEDIAQIQFESEARSAFEAVSSIETKLYGNQNKKFKLNNKDEILNQIYSCIKETSGNLRQCEDVVEENEKSAELLRKGFYAEAKGDLNIALNKYNQASKELSDHLSLSYLIIFKTSKLNKTNNVIEAYDDLISNVAWQSVDDESYLETHPLFCGLAGSIEMEDTKQTKEYLEKLVTNLPIAKEDAAVYRKKHGSNVGWRGMGYIDPVVPDFEAKNLLKKIN